LVSGMMEGFTGYLLPWDQTAYWATVVGINLNGTAPFLGPWLAQFLRSGQEIGGETLTRFYSLHMLVIPGAIIALITLHLYLVIRLGVTSPPWSKDAAGKEPEEAAAKQRPGLPRPARRSWHDELGAAPRLVLLLPLLPAPDLQVAGVGLPRHGRRADDRARSAHRPAVPRPPSRASAFRPSRRHGRRRPDHRLHGCAHLEGRDRERGPRVRGDPERSALDLGRAAAAFRDSWREPLRPGGLHSMSHV